MDGVQKEQRYQLGCEMSAALAEQNCTPYMMIGAETLGVEFYLTYKVAAHPQMTKEQMLYVLRRLTGLLDGSIKPTDMN